MKLSKEDWDWISLKTDDWWGTETSTCKFKGFTKEQLAEIKTIVQKNPSFDDWVEGVKNVQVISSHFPANWLTISGRSSGPCLQGVGIRQEQTEDGLACGREQLGRSKCSSRLIQ